LAYTLNFQLVAKIACLEQQIKILYSRTPSLV